MIEVREVKTKKDVRLFATYPLKLYKGCPYYVPSLRGDEKGTFNPKINLALEGNICKGFLCFKDGKLVGRIAGFISLADNEITKQKFVRFSRFECIDDIEVFKALLGAVEKFGAEQGMEIMHGPWGFNDSDREGMLTDGFDKRSTYATNYYYPYFYKRMKELGYEDESKWIERSFVIPKEPYEKMVNFSKKIQERLNVKEIASEMSVKKILKKYGDSFYKTYNESYSVLDSFVPIEGKAKEKMLDQFATIVNRRYVSILVDDKDEVVAFGVLLPSICNALIKHKGKLFPTGFIGVLKSIKKPTELEMALIGVRSDYKNSGANALVITRIMNNVIEDGIKVVESNPMLETNFSIQQQWKFAENEVVKKRQTFKKAISVDKQKLDA